jgi:hypothetical protein
MNPGARLTVLAVGLLVGLGVPGWADTTATGSVANFAQEVLKEQVPLSVGGLGGQGIEPFGHREALVSLLSHQLPFLEHVHQFDSNER